MRGLTEQQVVTVELAEAIIRMLDKDYEDALECMRNAANETVRLQGKEGDEYVELWGKVLGGLRELHERYYEGKGLEIEAEKLVLAYEAWRLCGDSEKAE